MICFVTYLWTKQSSTGEMCLPAQNTDYAALHVNRLRNMIWRNYRAPHRFILIVEDILTKDPLTMQAIDPRIEVYPMWPHLETLHAMGGCFRRLYLHTKECAKDLNISPKHDMIVQMDLDCVISAPITELFAADAANNFTINAYKPPAIAPGAPNPYPDQKYNGALQFFAPGAHENLYYDLMADPTHNIQRIRAATTNKQCIGTDQAWIRLYTQDKDLTLPTFDNEHGVYEFRQLRNLPAPPENARITFFAGGWDPSKVARQTQSQQPPRDPRRPGHKPAPKPAKAPCTGLCTPKIADLIVEHWR